MKLAAAPYAFKLQPARAAQTGELKGQDADILSSGSLVTPNGRFFVRNHFSIPTARAEDWKLRVNGLVRNPQEIGYSDILRLPRRQLTVTVECAGNGVGGGAVSTAVWTGVSLGELLRAAGLDSKVRFIRLSGADHGVVDSASQEIPFARSIPLEKAMHTDTLLAFEMNGAPLPAEHGYPLRALVPGWYGMDSVKWLASVEALEPEDLSYFMTERYVASRLLAVGTERQRISRMRVKSQITTPREGERLSLQPMAIRGAAWSGESTVSAVEISVDHGRNWMLAEFEGLRQRYTGILWKRVWTPPAPGSYTILARATDAEGRSQPVSKDRLRFDSYENNWYQSVRCEVL